MNIFGWLQVPLGRFIDKYSMLKRDLCPICNENQVAVNYVRNGIRHYRNSCTSCIRKSRKLRTQAPAWSKSGYKKPEKCDVCNFKAKMPAKQLFVFHVDGNLKNNAWVNLKTVCANCRIELVGKRVAWKPATIVPDF